MEEVSEQWKCSEPLNGFLGRWYEWLPLTTFGVPSECGKWLAVCALDTSSLVPSYITGTNDDSAVWEAINQTSHLLGKPTRPPFCHTLY